jgi:hypothetical protein
LVVGFVPGFSVMVYALLKYNKGIFWLINVKLWFWIISIASSHSLIFKNSVPIVTTLYKIQ